MSRRYKGGFISTTQPVTSLTQAKGIWTLEEQVVAQKAGQWPSTQPADPNFEYTTLLLNGDGTNGAQNNTFIDSSTNNFTITRTGTPTQGSFSPFSQTGWGGTFNGTSTYITTPDSTPLNLAGTSFTLEAFVFPNNVTSRQTIIEKRLTSGGFPVSYWMQISTTGAIQFSGVTLDIVSTAGVVIANQWNHIACCYDGTSLTMFANGNRVYGPTATSITNQAALISIGGSALSGFYMNGSISNLRVIKSGVLYSGSTYTVPTTTLTTTVSSGTVSLLALQSNRFVDNAVSPNVLTAVNSPSIQAFSPFNPTIAYSTAVVGGSGYFNGSTDVVNAPSNAAFAIGSIFTLEAWFYPLSSTGNILVGATGSGGAQIGYQSSTAFGLGSTGVSWQLTTTSVPILNSWNHVVICRGGIGTNQTSIFINGTRVANGTTSAAFTTTTTATLGGAPDVSNLMRGYVSNFREVKGVDVYGYTNTTITIPTAPLTAITGTSLLCNFTNAGIVDATAKNDVTTIGDAQVSTAVKKFGTGSMKFDGTTDYLQFPNNPLYAFGTGYFTVEFWVYQLTSGTYGIISFGNGSIAQPYFYINGAVPTILFNNTTVATGPAITLNTWTYVAFTRNASGITVTTNSTNGTTVADATNMSSAGLFIGASNSPAQYFNGYIDDLRITKGVARTITVPTQAFPVY